MSATSSTGRTDVGPAAERDTPAGRALLSAQSRFRDASLRGCLADCMVALDEIGSAWLPLRGYAAKMRALQERRAADTDDPKL